MAKKKDNRLILLLGLAGVAYWFLRPKDALAADVPQFDLTTVPLPVSPDVFAGVPLADPALFGVPTVSIPWVPVAPGTTPIPTPTPTPTPGPAAGNGLDPVDWGDQEPIDDWVAPPPAATNGSPAGAVRNCDEGPEPVFPGDTIADGCILTPWLPPPPFPPGLFPPPGAAGFTIPVLPTPGGAAGRGGLNLA